MPSSNRPRQLWSCLALCALWLCGTAAPLHAYIAKGITLVSWHPDSPVLCPAVGESQDYAGVEPKLWPGEHIHLSVTVGCFNCDAEVRFANCVANLGGPAAFRIGNPGTLADYTLDCAGSKVLSESDAVGKLVVKAVGSLVTTAGSPPIPKDCAEVWADVGGVMTLQGTIEVVACLDRDGVGGVGASDLSIWLADFFSGSYNPLADFDYDGVLGAGDLSLWLGYFFSACNTVSATPPCP